MALPPLVRRLAEAKMSNFCDGRVSAPVRDLLRHSFGVRGNTVTLFEERPSFRDKTVWTKLAVAQFRYVETDRCWRLYCADRKSKWHLYKGLEPSSTLDPLLAEVDADPTCIFWG